MNSELAVTVPTTNLLISTRQSQPNRYIDPQALVSKHDTISDHIANYESARDVDKHGLHIRIFEDKVKGSLHCSTRHFTACIEKVRTFTPEVWDCVDSVHCQTGAVDWEFL